MASKDKKNIEPVTIATDKKKALEIALAQIEKQYGKNSVMRMGQVAAQGADVVSTGSIGLDMALGIGGLPRGRIIEIYGPESSGKTTLALHAVASAQAAGGEAAYIDAEHALDPTYAAALGVDVDSLLVAQPDSGDQGLEIAEQLVRSGALDIIVIDSVAALTPRAEIEGEMGDAFVGLHARLMSQALRKLTSVISKSNCVAIFINQLREKVGVIYVNPEVTTGGRALKFYSSVRIEVRRVEHLKNGSQLIGSHTRAKVVKNKMAPPFREAQFDIMYGEGISRIGELVDLGVEYGLVRKSGAWFYMGETRIGQGRENAKKYMRENPETADQLEADIRAAIQEARDKAKADRAAASEAARQKIAARMAANAERAEQEGAEEAAPAEEKKKTRKSAAMSIEADDFGDDDI